MRSIRYSGEIWENSAVQPDLWNLLLEKDVLLEFSTGQPPYQVVLGVPHHAAPGVPRIANEWINLDTGKTGRTADETAGLSGLAVFSACQTRGISARLVIAAHASDHDPNKTPASAYWQRVLDPNMIDRQPPFLLFELHGAGKQRNHDLELSAGRNTLGKPLPFAQVLSGLLPNHWKLAAQTRPGASAGQLFSTQPRPCRLENPALETPILTQAGMVNIPALHLEMKPFLRQPDPIFPESPRPTRETWILAHALADTFTKISDLRL